MQLDRLSTSRPELHFAAKALSFSEQTMTIGKCGSLLLLGTACVWSMQPDGVFRSEAGLMAVVLFVGANFLMREETTTANPNWLKALSVLYTLGFFVVADFAVSITHPLLAAVGLGAFVWLFGMYAVDLATTAPMPVATQHRKGAASLLRSDGICSGGVVTVANAPSRRRCVGNGGRGRDDRPLG